MLFTVKELANRTIDETKNHPLMQKYIKWISNRQGEFRVKQSKRIKKKH
jgi:intein/homing endonuclease